MHPLRPTLVRTVLTASLLLALIGSPTASAQEAVEEPAGEAVQFSEEPVVTDASVAVETMASIINCVVSSTSLASPAVTPMLIAIHALPGRSP